MGWSLVIQSFGVFLKTWRSRIWRSLFRNCLQGTGETWGFALHRNIRIFSFLCFDFLENFKAVFVFQRWRFCGRRRILRRVLMLRSLRLLSSGRTMSISDRLELCFFRSKGIYWFLWFCKLGEDFGKVAVYMTKFAFEWNMLIIQFLDVTPIS